MWVYICYAVFIFVLIKDFFKKPSTYPPGPRQYPIVGNLFSVWYNLKKYRYHHMLWQAWTQTYGTVLGLRLGYMNVVIVSGYDLVREVSMREVFAGRPDGFFYMIRSFGKQIGLVFSESQNWIKTKRITIRYLKNFGFGSRAMEVYISEECRDLVKNRLQDSGLPVKADGMFDISISNILWRIIAGKRYELNDKQLLRICDIMSESFRSADMSGGILNFLPFLRHLAPNLTGYARNKKIHDEIYDFIREIVKDHKETLDVKNPRDIIDAFLIEMLDAQTKISDEELLVVCRDLLEAGVETTSRTADFLILHIVRNNHVQARLQKEIDTVIGHSRLPSLNDRNRMVYTEAVLMEALRISAVAPVGIPHMTLDDAQLGRYTIPKGTMVLLSLYDVLNGSHWKEPHIFRPERFLTKEGNLLQDEWLMPFGTGRRKCIGEGLARSELFMFLTHLLQKFHIKLPIGDTMPKTEPINGVSLSTQPFRVVFVPRS